MPSKRHFVCSRGHYQTRDKNATECLQGGCDGVLEETSKNPAEYVGRLMS